jgi:hypothetical protein
MKQTALLRWIEAAEARSVCLIAEEDPARAAIDPASNGTQPLNLLLATLREQLCLAEAARRLSRARSALERRMH